MIIQDNAAAKHPDYDNLARERKIYKDVYAGTLALRAGKQLYLRKFAAELENSYIDRLNSSTLFNITEKTANIMTGLVFQGEIELQPDVPATIVGLAENIDNKGNHLNVFAREVFLDSFEGLSLILVDSPAALNVESLEDQQRLEIRPYWIKYKADDIINWETRINPISRSTELSLLVLREITQEKAGTYLKTTVTRYRVYYLDADNNVAWELFKEFKASTTATQIELKLEGQGVIEKVSAIPVAIIYGQKKDTLKGSPPLLDLALANLRHYNKQSNYDNLLMLACIPVPFTKGLETADNKILAFGSDILMKLSENGEFGWATVDAGAFASLQKDLHNLEQQMAVLGLSMLADKTQGVDLTATEALLNSINETAELRVMATSLKDALELAMGYTAEFLGLGRDAGGSIKLQAAWSEIEIIADVSDSVLPPNDNDEIGLVN